MSAVSENIESLQKRLQVSDEWNMRLQSQIQELLRLPRSEVEAMRSRMHNPDIAIPLLQCYDAAILEKQEENEKLQQENGKLKAKLEATTGELEETREAVRAAETLVKEVRAQAQADHDSVDAARHEAEREAAQTRQE
ncbi:hypothetical protein DQ04_24171000, partial [Trypanosoma grayi]|uniref:hypothetical protein n=1 Tax=Trypanosoma grayi TaxID=71804 RepID=UPI0004F419FF